MVTFGRGAGAFSELTPQAVVVDATGSGEGVDVDLRLVACLGEQIEELLAGPGQTRRGRRPRFEHAAAREDPMQHSGGFEPPGRLLLVHGPAQAGEGVDQGRVDAEMVRLRRSGEEVACDAVPSTPGEAAPAFLPAEVGVRVVPGPDIGWQAEEIAGQQFARPPRVGPDAAPVDDIDQATNVIPVPLFAVVLLELALEPTRRTAGESLLGVLVPVRIGDVVHHWAHAWQYARHPKKSK